MKFPTLLSSTIALAAAFVSAAPIGNNNSNNTTLTDVPQEAIIGYLDFGTDNDLAVMPFANDTNSGLLFINTTIAKAAFEEEGNELSLNKREASPGWHWLQLAPGEPLYKRDAEAGWHWLQLSPGEPLYKREAGWHWLQLAPGEPLY